MTRRQLGISLLTAGWLGLGTGAAWAQGEPCDMPSMGDPCGAGGETAPMAGEAAAEQAPRPGALKAGAKLMIPKGVENFVGDIGFSWAELTPWARYQVNEKIAAGLSIPLIVVKPEAQDLFEIDTLQAIVIDGEYAVGPKIAAKAMVGYGVPARLAINPFGSGIGLPGGGGDFELGFGLGGGYVHRMDRIRLSADALLIVQLDSAEDGADTKTLTVLHVPLAATYAIGDKVTAGVATGLYTGDKLSFDPDESFTLPLVVGGKYAVKPNVDVGGFLGVGSIVPGEGLEVGDTLTLGFFATYSK